MKTKERAKEHIEGLYLAYSDAVTAEDNDLIALLFNRLEGAIELYEIAFNEMVCYRYGGGVRYEAR